MGQLLAHQQLAVAGEQDAVLEDGEARQGSVPQVIVPNGVEAEHPQPPGQGPQMGIGEKAQPSALHPGKQGAFAQPAAGEPVAHQFGRAGA